MQTVAAGIPIREGIVDGNRLRFKVNLGGKDISAELVMDEGAKSFKGNIDGDATTGSFVGPYNP